LHGKDESFAFLVPTFSLGSFALAHAFSLGSFAFACLLPARSFRTRRALFELPILHDGVLRLQVQHIDEDRVDRAPLSPTHPRACGELAASVEASEPSLAASVRTTLQANEREEMETSVQ